MTNLYYIENNGCDDTTHGLARMSDEEFEKFKSIIENLNKNSTYGCMSTITVFKIDNGLIRPARDYDSSECILYMNDGEYALGDSIYDWSFETGLVYKEGVERVI